MKVFHCCSTWYRSFRIISMCLSISLSPMVNYAFAGFDLVELDPVSQEKVVSVNPASHSSPAVATVKEEKKQHTVNLVIHGVKQRYELVRVFGYILSSFDGVDRVDLEDSGLQDGKSKLQWKLILRDTDARTIGKKLVQTCNNPEQFVADLKIDRALLTELRTLQPIVENTNSLVFVLAGEMAAETHGYTRPYWSSARASGFD